MFCFVDVANWLIDASSPVSVFLVSCAFSKFRCKSKVFSYRRRRRRRFVNEEQEIFLIQSWKFCCGGKMKNFFTCCYYYCCPFVVFLLLLLLLGVVEGGRFDELEVKVEHQVDNCERRTKDGDLLSMHYVGKLASDLTVFDSSHDRQQPFVFQLGRRQVIPGWDQGLKEMCVQEKRILNIPSHLAYGKTGAGDRIPPDSDLIFEVELLDIKDNPPPVNVFKEIDVDMDGLLSPEEVGGYLRNQIPADMKKEEAASFDQDTMVKEIFEHEDRDKNGFISRDEFSGPKHDEL